ncbi:hypothetical protein H6P81_004285 [Aristolochia fimbriata]|uniref:Uncharacterized protein n=1 Tax=Aristolochia fimbriata TaxID=158543 RepID=A0AAV7FHH4_ARIFI|nr:hypothetical protein H6P81_004285 [Aristolochia fimbriata]
MAIVHPVETTSTPSTTELLQAINQLVKQGNFANLTLEAVGKQLQQMEVIKSPLIHPPMKLEMLPEDETADLLEVSREDRFRTDKHSAEKQTYRQTLPSSSQAVHVKQEHRSGFLQVDLNLST